jgi:hypothetical protein
MKYPTMMMIWHTSATQKSQCCETAHLSVKNEAKTQQCGTHTQGVHGTIASCNIPKGCIREHTTRPILKRFRCQRVLGIPEVEALTLFGAVALAMMTTTEPSICAIASVAHTCNRDKV